VDERLAVHSIWMGQAIIDKKKPAEGEPSAGFPLALWDGAGLSLALQDRTKYRVRGERGGQTTAPPG
jgi:hypothetical protein